MEFTSDGIPGQVSGKHGLARELDSLYSDSSANASQEPSVGRQEGCVGSSTCVVKPFRRPSLRHRHCSSRSNRTVNLPLNLVTQIPSTKRSREQIQDPRLLKVRKNSLTCVDFAMPKFYKDLKSQENSYLNASNPDYDQWPNTAVPPRLQGFYSPTTNMNCPPGYSSNSIGYFNGMESLLASEQQSIFNQRSWNYEDYSFNWKRTFLRPEENNQQWPSSYLPNNNEVISEERRLWNSNTFPNHFVRPYEQQSAFPFNINETGVSPSEGSLWDGGKFPNDFQRPDLTGWPSTYRSRKRGPHPQQNYFGNDYKVPQTFGQPQGPNPQRPSLEQDHRNQDKLLLKGKSSVENCVRPNGQSQPLWPTWPKQSNQTLTKKDRLPKTPTFPSTFESQETDSAQDIACDSTFPTMCTASERLQGNSLHIDETQISHQNLQKSSKPVGYTKPLRRQDFSGRNLEATQSKEQRPLIANSPKKQKVKSSKNRNRFSRLRHQKSLQPSTSCSSENHQETPSKSYRHGRVKRSRLVPSKTCLIKAGRGSKGELHHERQPILSRTSVKQRQLDNEKKCIQKSRSRKRKYVSVMTLSPSETSCDPEVSENPLVIHLPEEQNISDHDIPGAIVSSCYESPVNSPASIESQCEENNPDNSKQAPDFKIDLSQKSPKMYVDDSLFPGAKITRIGPSDSCLTTTHLKATNLLDVEIVPANVFKSKNTDSETTVKTFCSKTGKVRNLNLVGMIQLPKDLQLQTISHNEEQSLQTQKTWSTVNKEVAAPMELKSSYRLTNMPIINHRTGDEREVTRSMSSVRRGAARAKSTKEVLSTLSKNHGDVKERAVSTPNSTNKCFKDSLIMAHGISITPLKRNYTDMLQNSHGLEAEWAVSPLKSTSNLTSTPQPSDDEWEDTPIPWPIECRNSSDKMGSSEHNLFSDMVPSSLTAFKDTQTGFHKESPNTEQFNSPGQQNYIFAEPTYILPRNNMKLSVKGQENVKTVSEKSYAGTSVEQNHGKTDSSIRSSLRLREKVQRRSNSSRKFEKKCCENMCKGTLSSKALKRKTCSETLEAKAKRLCRPFQILVTRVKTDVNGSYFLSYQNLKDSEESDGKLALKKRNHSSKATRPSEENKKRQHTKLQVSNVESTSDWTSKIEPKNQDFKVNQSHTAYQYMQSTLEEIFKSKPKKIFGKDFQLSKLPKRIRRRRNSRKHSLTNVKSREPSYPSFPPAFSVKQSLKDDKIQPDFYEKDEMTETFKFRMIPKQKPRCQFCDMFSAQFDEDVKSHIAQSHPYRCVKCCMTFADKKERSTHMYEHLSEVHHCSVCKRDFYSLHLFRRHILGKGHLQLADVQKNTFNMIRQLFRSHLMGFGELNYGSGSVTLFKLKDNLPSTFSSLTNNTFVKHYHQDLEFESLIKKFEDKELNDITSAISMSNPNSTPLKSIELGDAPTANTDGVLNENMELEAIERSISDSFSDDNCSLSSSLFDITQEDDLFLMSLLGLNSGEKIVELPSSVETSTLQDLDESHWNGERRTKERENIAEENPTCTEEPMSANVTVSTSCSKKATSSVNDGRELTGAGVTPNGTGCEESSNSAHQLKVDFLTTSKNNNVCEILAKSPSARFQAIRSQSTKGTDSENSNEHTCDNVTDSLNTDIADSLNTNVSDCLNTSVTDPLKTNVTDSLNTNVTDSLNTNVTDSLNTNVTDSLNTNVTDSLKTNVTDSLNTNVTDSLNTNISDSLNTSVTDPLNTNVADCLNTNITDSLNTNVPDSLNTKEAVSNTNTSVEVDGFVVTSCTTANTAPLELNNELNGPPANKITQNPNNSYGMGSNLCDMDLADFAKVHYTTSDTTLTDTSSEQRSTSLGDKGLSVPALTKIYDLSCDWSETDLDEDCSHLEDPGKLIIDLPDSPQKSKLASQTVSNSDTCLHNVTSKSSTEVDHTDARSKDEGSKLQIVSVNNVKGDYFTDGDTVLFNQTTVDNPEGHNRNKVEQSYLGKATRNISQNANTTHGLQESTCSGKGGGEGFLSISESKICCENTNIDRTVDSRRSTNVDKAVDTRHSTNVDKAVDTRRSTNVDKAVDTRHSTNVDKAVDSRSSTNVDKAVDTRHSTNVDKAVDTRRSTDVDKAVDSRRSTNVDKAVDSRRSTNVDKAVDSRSSTNVDKAVDTRHSTNVDKAVDTRRSTDVDKAVDSRRSTNVDKDVDTRRSTNVDKAVDSRRSTDVDKAVDTRRSTNVEKVVDTRHSTNVDKAVDSRRSTDVDKAVDTRRSTNVDKDVDSRSSTKTVEPLYPEVVVTNNDTPNDKMYEEVQQKMVNYDTVANTSGDLMKDPTSDTKLTECKQDHFSADLPLVETPSILTQSVHTENLVGKISENTKCNSTIVAISENAKCTSTIVATQDTTSGAHQSCVMDDDATLTNHAPIYSRCSAREENSENNHRYNQNCVKINRGFYKSPQRISSEKLKTYRFDLNSLLADFPYDPNCGLIGYNTVTVASTLMNEDINAHGEKYFQLL